MKLAQRISVGILLYCFLAGAVSFAAAPQPKVTNARDVQYGLASWYGRHWRGRKTASGAAFDDRALTAAHRTLPLGKKVQVTNLKNGRSVVVKINDRGPVPRHRLIDLSRAAADRIGITHRGVARVKVQVIKNDGGPKPVTEKPDSAPPQPHNINPGPAKPSATEP